MNLLRNSAIFAERVAIVTAAIIGGTLLLFGTGYIFFKGLQSLHNYCQVVDCRKVFQNGLTTEAPKKTSPMRRGLHEDQTKITFNGNEAGVGAGQIFGTRGKKYLSGRPGDNSLLSRSDRQPPLAKSASSFDAVVIDSGRATACDTAHSKRNDSPTPGYDRPLSTWAHDCRGEFRWLHCDDWIDYRLVTRSVAVSQYREGVDQLFSKALAQVGRQGCG